MVVLEQVHELGHTGRIATTPNQQALSPELVPQVRNLTPAPLVLGALVTIVAAQFAWFGLLLFAVIHFAT